MRTLEEFARFVEEEPGSSGTLKSLRHELASALARLPRQRLLAARDTVGDVGTAIGRPEEYRRASLGEVVAAAAARTQQSLRCLEEYGKMIDSAFGGSIERIRYRCYTVAAEIELRIEPDRRRLLLSEGLLYVLVDADDSSEAFTEKIRTLAAAGVDLFQLRDHSHDDRTLYERALLGARVARDLGVLFIVNDRADLAVAAEADGVHVGQDELPAAAARRIVGRDRLIGVSTHSLQQAREAVDEGADYIGCGPVFPGPTKQFDTYVGQALLRQVAGELAVPAFAIGGITLDNLAEVRAAGFRRVAVTSAINAAADPAQATREWKLQLASPSE